MSECEKYKKIIESVANGECSEADKALLDAHVSECSDCREELAFVMSINETLQSLPKMEVPEDFLVSLNKRLDVEDKIKAYTSDKAKKNIFKAWKKYSAITACLLLAVLVQINVWDLPVNNGSNDVVVEVSDESAAKKSDKSVSDDTAEVERESADVDITGEENIQVTDNQSAKEVEFFLGEGKNQKNTSNKPTAKAENKDKSDKLLQKKQVVTEKKAPVQTTPVPKKQENSYSAESENKTHVVTKQNNEPKINNQEVAQTQTPQTSDNQPLPEYMDNKDNIIIVPEGTSRVNFDDYEIVVTEEFLEAFSMAEMPSNNVIVASPAAMASIVNVSIDTSAACPVPETNYGAGSGSLLVAASDVQKVQSILNKYSTGAQNQTFMLTSSNYNSFINELKGEGIEYQDYMIHAGKSNVAFTLIAS